MALRCLESKNLVLGFSSEESKQSISQNKNIWNPLLKISPKYQSQPLQKHMMVVKSISDDRLNLNWHEGYDKLVPNLFHPFLLTFNAHFFINV